jgi:hypothetical protein
MGVKSFLSARVLSPILIAGAFFLGRFTASWPDANASRAAGDSKMAIPEGQRVIGFLDMVQGQPTIVARREGDVQLSGWAACADAGSTLVKVEILVDDQVRANATTGYPRADVRAAFGRPDFEKSGWKALFSASGMETGQHSLKASVTCSKGEIGLLPAFTLNIARE